MNEEHNAISSTDKPKRQASRGDFLKWGTIAMSGMYVGPKITSFSVAQGGGQTGSIAPGQTPPGNFNGTPPSFNLPPTGGAAQMPRTNMGTAAVTPSGTSSGVPSWLPAAGVGAAALGLYSVQKAKTPKAVQVSDGDAEKA